MWIDIATALAAVGALLISIATYFTTRPRIRVHLSGPALNLDSDQDVQSIVTVEVVNTGRAAGHIRSLALVATDCTFSADASHGLARKDFRKVVRGPQPPLILAPTELAIWSFDHAVLKHDAKRRVHLDPLVLRAHVQVGHRIFKSSHRLALEGVAEVRAQSRRVRFITWCKSFRTGRIQVDVSVSPDDYAEGVLTLSVRNTGRGFCRRVVVYLVHTDADGADSLVPEAPVYRWRFLRPGAEKILRPSLEVAAAPDGGGNFLWMAASYRGGGQGQGVPPARLIHEHFSIGEGGRPPA